LYTATARAADEAQLAEKRGGEERGGVGRCKLSFS
jgi:hypothetical protein